MLLMMHKYWLVLVILHHPIDYVYQQQKICGYCDCCSLHPIQNQAISLKIIHVAQLGAAVLHL